MSILLKSGGGHSDLQLLFSIIQRDLAEQDGLGHGKKGRRNLLIKTKKLSCPALIGVSRIVKFPGFKVL